MSLDQQSVISLFLLYVKVEVYRNILKLRCWSFAFTLYTGLPTSFSAWFLKKKKKNGFKLYYIHRPNFFAGLLLLLKILGNTCFVTICCPVCDVINFEINRSFLTKLTFSYIIKKSKQKCKYLKNERNFYQEIKSVFHNF